MKDNSQKNILFLVVAGFVFVAVNAAVWMGTKNGQLAPIDNIPLWGAFVILNVCSLLWAVSLMGLQPMVVAFSYVAGGFLAFQGVRLLPEVNIAEVTTAGATYGAFGALAVGNATTKVRLAFFRKGQVPFVLVIVVLLVLDGFLNSQVSNSGWNVIVSALIFPFMLSGVIIGLIWLVLTRLGIGHNPSARPVAAVSEVLGEQEAFEEASDEAAQLMIKIPEAVEAVEELQDVAVAMEVVEPVEESDPVKREVSEEPAVSAMLENNLEVKNDSSAAFFPLEIDKDDDFILPQEDSNLMEVATLVAEGTLEEAVEALEGIDEEIVVSSTVEVDMEPEKVEAVVEPIEEHIEVTQPASATNLDEVDEPVEEAKETNAGSLDWLDGHLDLLNKLK